MSFKTKFFFEITIVIISFAFFLSPTGLHCQEQTMPTKHRQQMLEGQTETQIASEDKLLQVAQMAISSSQNAIGTMQVTVSFLSLALVIITFVSFVIVLLYRKKIEKMGGRLNKTNESIQAIDNLSENLKQEVVNFENKTRKIETSFNNFNKTQDDLIKQYKKIAKHAEALSCVFQIRDPNPKIRLEYLQKLSQLRHPVGIVPMIELLNNNEKEEIQCEAALGLGRYAENKDTDGHWAAILDKLNHLLENENLRINVAIEVIKSAVKYQTDARGLIAPIIKWSKKPEAEIRRVCAVAFGDSKIYDHGIIQRLEEIVAADEAKEVRKAAENSLNLLKKHNNPAIFGEY